MWRVLTQDAFCYFGELPEDYDDTGESYDTREEALDAGLDFLREVFRMERGEAGVNARQCALLWQEKREDLTDSGECSLTLPCHEEGDGEDPETGTRFVSVRVTDGESEAEAGDFAQDSEE